MADNSGLLILFVGLIARDSENERNKVFGDTISAIGFVKVVEEFLKPNEPRH